MIIRTECNHPFEGHQGHFVLRVWVKHYTFENGTHTHTATWVPAFEILVFGESPISLKQRGRRREEGSDRSLVWASPSNNFSCMHCRVSMGWCGCIQLSIWDKGREGYPPFPQVLFTIFPRFNNSFIRERNKKLMVKRSKQKWSK